MNVSYMECIVLTVMDPVWTVIIKLMMSQNQGYRIYNDVRKENNPFNWRAGCSECKKPFDHKESFVRVDIQNGWFRGDDEVVCFHKGDCASRGINKISNPR